MKIRLHLVRFMYINLILSCCFWLYDNVVAADVSSFNAATAAGNAIAAGVERFKSSQQLPFASVASDTDQQQTSNSLDNSYSKHFATEKAPAPTTTPHGEGGGGGGEAAGATASATLTTDSLGLKLGTEPRTSVKTKVKTITKPAAVIDTSVKLNVVPSSVNRNNNNEYTNIVPNSENNINTNNKNAKEKQATAKVPNNQLNYNNQINNNIYINTNVGAEQLEKLQHTNIVAANDVAPANEEQQQQQQQHQQESFPEVITELPAVTITELPLELDLGKDRLDAVILQEATDAAASNKSSKHDQQAEAFEVTKQIAQQDELKINDPGGGQTLEALSPPELNATVGSPNATNEEGGQSGDAAASDAGANNETVEEVPMPVFSEWAQKQMEAEASREQAMELKQQVVNNSAQRRNNTGNGNGKSPPLKLRAKNYASPDCGAKIIASNGDATNTGAVLSHSSDEYMLSTCGSRIWFVVELCEAVQAQKVELANFELFSSSPRNFTVAVSKRFPTRDWSNVGRFVAEDKRTVQTFELHPHLFGKFVRVDIHSHYSKEHFCPISLFRVFGTSEYEAFETEIRHNDEMDDFDDDFTGQEQKASQGNAGGANIFQSASDAVIQMVKKAAQVLVKPTRSLRLSAESLICRTPAAGFYQCPRCNSTTVERINNVLSCHYQQLLQLLALPQLRAELLQTRVCQADYDISFGLESHATSGLEKKQSFFLNILPMEQVGAMCKLLEIEYNSNLDQHVHKPDQQHSEQQQNLKLSEQPIENTTAAEASLESTSATTITAPDEGSSASTAPSLEIVPTESPHTANLPKTAEQPGPQTIDGSKIAPTPADVNIFNVPSDTQEAATVGTAPITSETATATLPTVNQIEANDVESSTNPTSTATATTATTGDDLIGSGNGMVDENNLTNWESIDSLLTTTVASITAGGGAAAAAAAVVNGNANLGGTINGAVGNGATVAGGGINLQPKLTHGAQSESVFIRLSNRIKALERNMSLSGQYLEELSRRYKKQVEELQQTLTQQTLTVRTLEDQSRRYIEQEQLYKQEHAELAGEVRSLTYQVQACIMVIILVGTCFFLLLMVGTVFYRKLRRQTQQLQPKAKTTPTKRKLSRRKSYEQIVEQSPGKQRRPSEEAMLILNGCGDVSQVQPIEADTSRQRKISICYGSNNNIAANMLNGRTSLHKRKSSRHLLPYNSLDSAQVSGNEQLDRFFDVDTLKSNKPPTKAIKKKSQQQQQELKRQQSAPANYKQGSLTEEPSQSDFDESLMLDDDDLSNFIPNSDLAYNEFMPEGPSGYQIVDTVDGKMPTEKAKKSRRVSSPAFFKSPFSKSKIKAGSFNGMSGVKGSQSAHEATSWEWYRLRRSEKQPKHHSTVPAVSASASVTPNASIDSSSLSEINFPFNTTQNSFRILGEAIRTSGEDRLNGKKSSNSVNAVASSSSSSGASTTSSTTKKKQRSFNNIFRKVF